MQKLLIGITILVGIILLIPTIGIVLGSIRTDQGLAKSPPDFIPRELTLENYKRLFAYPIGEWAWNSVKILVLSTALMLVVTLFAGYGFAKYNSPIKEKIFWLLIATMLIPAAATFIPGFVVIKKLGLVNTHGALIYTGAMSIPFIFYYRRYIEKIPNDFIDMATIDGCNELRIFTSIILPLTIPAISTIIILTVLPKWNDFMTPLLYLFTPDKFTLPLGIQQVLYSDAMQRQNDFVPNFGLMMAGGTVMFAPMMIVFYLFKNSFAKGLWGGGLK
jgi:multiple sugar transport system permease protein